MNKALNAVVGVAKSLGFQTANGTETGARGFSIVDGFGRTKFVSFLIMCRLCASITNVRGPYLGKTFRTPHFDFNMSVDGNLLVVFKDGVSLFFDKEKLEPAVSIAASVPYYVFIELQYVKNKNSKKGSYVRNSGYFHEPNIVKVG